MQVTTLRLIDVGQEAPGARAVAGHLPRGQLVGAEAGADTSAPVSAEREHERAEALAAQLARHRDEEDERGRLGDDLAAQAGERVARDPLRAAARSRADYPLGVTSLAARPRSPGGRCRKPRR